jgi:hypothetical protein
VNDLASIPRRRKGARTHSLAVFSAGNGSLRIAGRGRGWAILPAHPFCIAETGARAIIVNCPDDLSRYGGMGCGDNSGKMDGNSQGLQRILASQMRVYIEVAVYFDSSPFAETR